MRKFFLTIIAICILPIVIYVSYGICLTLLGYELGQSPEQLAEKLVQENRPASDCDLLRTLDVLMRPTTDELQARCIRVYARLKKDPSACELLMPSSYGLSCIGAAAKNKPCRFDDQKNVIWNDGEYHEVPFDQCSKDTGSDLGNMCCKAAVAKFDPAFIDGCSQFQSYDPLLADYCQYEVSRKELDPSLCKKIDDNNLQAACLLEVQTLKDNPDLRDAYPFINNSQ